jgi:hypothetical protein
VSADTITILRARRRLAKLWKADGTSEGYEDAKHYDLHAEPVESLDALHGLLVELLPRPDCGVVRGAILDPARTQGVRRLVHADPETGDQPTLRDTAHHWLALDVDGVPLPAEVNPLDLAACARAVLPMLPEPVRDADLIVQATGSHGMKPGARLRLWGWFDRALTGAELKRWFRDGPVDASLFRPAQVNYTAAPVFAAGATDPLPERLVRLAGATPLILAPSAAALTPPQKPAEPAPRLNAASGSRYALAALTRACTNISRQGEGSRHPTAVSEALGLARLVNAGLLTQAEVTRAVDGALRQAGKPTGEGTAIVAWALSRRTDTGNLPAGVRA